MAQSDTVDRILNAATVLFAERGFAETSLRTITGMAGVNLASVNYHFGSKKELIQAVFKRFLEPYCRELDRCAEQLVSQVPEGETPSIDAILKCLLHTLLSSMKKMDEDPQRFMRLLSLAYTQSQEHLRHYLAQNFGSTYQKFSHLVRASNPHLDTVELYWRTYFMLGAAIFTLSSYDSIRAILNSDYSEDTSLEDTVELLIPSLAGMLKSPNV
ncbi:TetR/AcrR family transcriptional regulator [Teredinibacter sp. KSP-S5-2]|uniref:TetR/AcrR family transcriptional regulator n=1 Tax=Teredinibacter sp. KSP-S5-2 TaxID=3034506 RepID=UPI00293424EC|nr:TetR/AcrR family transcriptional regulator [Teredinibacter sp. KSP-S5-2]WNO07580.1 TetR/AcrR family transcriptional regulator [Teredinibacter sp. KSP-S5-2]